MLARRASRIIVHRKSSCAFRQTRTLTHSRVFPARLRRWSCRKAGPLPVPRNRRTTFARKRIRSLTPAHGANACGTNARQWFAIPLRVLRIDHISSPCSFYNQLAGAQLLFQFLFLSCFTGHHLNTIVPIIYCSRSQCSSKAN